MCGRFALTIRDLLKFLEKRQGVKIPDGLIDRFNVAPGQMSFVFYQKGADPAGELMKFGLIPHWAKEADIGYKMINARSETILEKPAYKKPFLSQRCIIPVSGFYEWKTVGKKKEPYFFSAPDNSPLGLAGIYDKWSDPKTGKEVLTFSIITTGAGKSMKPYHDRMPVILEPEKQDLWLNAQEAKQLLEFFKPYDKIAVRQVSTAVNKAKEDNPHLLDPV